MKTKTLLCTLLFAVNVLADEPKSKADRDPWNGFAVGSWVIEADTITVDGKAETKREKLTRETGKDKETIQLKRQKEGKKPGIFDGGDSTSWHIPGYDPALDPKSKLLETSKKDLKIKDKTYPCEVKKYDLSGENHKATATYWRCKEANVPYREIGLDPRTLALHTDVLRLEVDYSTKNKSEKTMLQVTDFKFVHTLGNRKIVCVRDEGTGEIIEGDNKGKATIIQLLSSEVPGRVVEIMSEGEFEGKKFKKQKTIEAYEVAKEK